MGRVTDYKEYDTDGTTRLYEKQDTYNTKSQLTSEIVTDVRTQDATWIWTSYYDYSEGGTWNSGTLSFSNTGGYDGGVVTQQETMTTKNGTPQAETNTQNLYHWTDGALQLCGRSAGSISRS
jgi:hypothetical protein